MDVSAATTKDDIEDCSEGESDVPSSQVASSTLAPPGVSGRFESYLGARQLDGGAQFEADTTVAGETDFTKAFEAIAEDDIFNAPVNVGESSTLNIEKDATLPAEADIFAAYRDDDANATQPAAEADTLPEEVEANGDGTFTGGPATEVEANDDGSSDGEDAVGLSGMPDSTQGPVPEEAWKSRPRAEREMWERVRPRAVRREAASVKELTFPAATMNRLMRLHPDMHSKTSDALETINCATVLLLQTVAQATIRGRRAVGQRVKLDDVKQVCLSNRELNFMLPLSATLDPSTLCMSRHDADDGAGVKGIARVVAGPGQSTLSSAIFGRANGTMDGDGVDVEDSNLGSPVKAPQAKKGSKRKLLPSGKQPTRKVHLPNGPENATEPEKSAATLGSFFNKTEGN